MSPSLFTEHRFTCDLFLRPTGELAVWLVGLLLAVSLLLFTDQSVTVLSPSLVINHGAAPIKSGWLFASKGLPGFTTDMRTGHLIARILFLHLLQCSCWPFEGSSTFCETYVAPKMQG